MTMQKNIACILLIVLLNACVRVVDFTVPFERQLVVHSFIRPAQAIINNDTILVAVSTNTPIVGNQAKTEITNATVTLAGPNQRATLRLLAANPADRANQTRRYGISQRDFLISPNENYSVSVTTTDGLRAEGSCQIPANKVAESAVKITIIEKTKDKIRCRIDWPDLPASNTLYLCSVGIGLSKGAQRSFSSIYVYRNDGEALNGTMTTNELTFSNFGFEYDPAQSVIYVAVATLDKNYYDWGAKQILQRRQNDGNLFPEPVFLNGNVADNLGVVAGYNPALIVKLF